MKHDKINETAKPPPQPSDYLDDFDGGDLTEAQSRELLETLFNIMKSFVMMGHGMEPVNKLITELQDCTERHDGDHE